MAGRANAKKSSSKKSKKQSDSELNRIAKWAIKFGIYQPKDNTLTRKRRSTLAKIGRDFAEQMKPNSEFIFAPIPKETKRKERKDISDKGAQIGGKATKTGLFVPAEKHKKARVGKDKKTGEFFVEKSGKVKKGDTTQRKIKSRTPLSGLDALEKEKERLRKLGEGLGPLRKGERIVFVIRDEQGEGVSNRTYDTVERIFSDLDNYRKNVPTRTGFYRHVTIEKWTPQQIKNSDQAKRDREKAKRSRVGRSGPHDTRRSKGR